MRCESCRHEKLLAFSCKKRGFCPGCGARRMVDSAAQLSDAVLPKVPLRQWELSVPFQLRFLFAGYPELLSRALRIVYRCIATHLIHQEGFTHSSTRTGALTFILTRFHGVFAPQQQAPHEHHAGRQRYRQQNR